MADFSTIACTEVHGTRVESLSYKGGPTAKVTLECDYADRFALRSDLLNNGYWPYSGGGYVPRVQNVSVKPLPTDYTQDGQAIAYKYAWLDVDYAMDESAGTVQGGGAGAGRQLYTETFEPQLEVFSVENGRYWLDKQFGAVKPGGVPSAQKDFETPPSIRQYTFSIRRVFYNWVSVPTTFATLLGYVNDDVVTFASLGLSFAAETLQFKPRSSHRAVSTTGTAGYTVAVDFVYREHGWNKFPSVNDFGLLYWVPAWTNYVDPTTGDSSVAEFKPYPLGDFSDWAF